MNWNEADAGKKYAQQVAARRGWKLNPDADLTDYISANLATIALRLGKPYCPCRDVDGGAKDADIVCPCHYSEADIQQFGQCFCGLFLSPSKEPSEVTSIPERRPD